MPELPEVETTRLGLVPRVVGRRILEVVVREPRLRWPVPKDLASRLRGARIDDILRRGKYLLFRAGDGHLLVHLGMSGSLTVVPPGSPVRRHDHVDLALDSGEVVRLNDPRRFGAMLWVRDPARHALLAGLGVEPFDEAFGGEYLHRLSRGRRAPVKAFLMDARVVTGIGNIYANESAVRRGHPSLAARGPRLARPLRPPRRRGPRHALARARRRRQHAARLRGRGRRARALPVRVRRLRARGRAVPGLRNGPVRATRHSGRATFYCPSCQR